MSESRRRRAGAGAEPRQPGRITAAIAGSAGLIVLLAACSPSISQHAEKGGTDFQREYGGCLAEAGFEVTAGSDGSLQGEIPAGQEDVYFAARDRCAEQFRAGKRGTLSDELMRQGYDLMVESRTCLVSLGFDLAEAPSFQTYAEQGAVYTPFAELPASVLGDLDAIEDDCPQPDLEPEG